RRTASEYKRFPTLVLPSSIVATFSQSGQPFLLRLLFPLREVGLFAVANRVLTAPTALIGGAVSEAFRAEFVARMRSGSDITAFFLKTVKRMLIIGLPVYSVVSLVAPWLFSFVFGADYHEAGVFARYLCA